MTSSPALPANAATSSSSRVWPFAFALFWCVVLGVLVFTSSNPVVLNPTQVAAAQVIAQGEWVPGRPPQLRVHKVWKGQLATDSVVIAGTVPAALITGEVLVPLSRISGDRASPDTFEITQGRLENRPRSLPSGTPELGILAEVQPLVYPATPESLAQLQNLLQIEAGTWEHRAPPAAAP